MKREKVEGELRRKLEEKEIELRQKILQLRKRMLKSGKKIPNLNRKKNWYIKLSGGW
ncbi:MAG: hypothetical protein GX089_03970 [Fibrobacter sp.]|nr:hypothetical protein [Fibrobacter sp.]